MSLLANYSYKRYVLRRHFVSFHLFLYELSFFVFIFFILSNLYYVVSHIVVVNINTKFLFSCWLLDLCTTMNSNYYCIARVYNWTLLLSNNNNNNNEFMIPLYCCGQTLLGLCMCCRPVIVANKWLRRRVIEYNVLFTDDLCLCCCYSRAAFFLIKAPF